MNVLFVHSYEVGLVDGKEILGPFMQATVDHVRNCANQYDMIILLGGWHSAQLGEDRLLTDVLQEQLTQTIDVKKIRTPRDFDFGYRYMPPRSTEEDIVLARMIRDSAFDLKDIQLYVCLVHVFALKAVPYYRQLGIELAGLELVIPPPGIPEKNLEIFDAVMLQHQRNQLDPTLSSPETKKHLEERTLGVGYHRPDIAELI